MQRSLLRALPLALACTAGALAADSQVWVVDAASGPGADFTELQAAADAAGEGDTLLVRSGNYGPLSIDAKSLIVVEDEGAVAKVNGDQIHVRNLGASQRVILSGLECVGPFQIFGNPYQPDLSAPLLLENNAGVVWIEDCSFVALPGNGFVYAGAGAVARQCAQLVLLRSTFLGSGATDEQSMPDDVNVVAGLAATDCAIHAYDSVMRGASGPTLLFLSPAPGGPGLALDGGTLTASNCVLQGGHGSASTPFSHVSPCTNAGDGGTGLVLLGAGTSAVTALDCAILGGDPGLPLAPCAAGAPGDAMDLGTGSLHLLPGEARSFAASTPVREQSAAQLDFEGEPGDLWVVFFSPGSQPFALGGLGGSFVLGLPYVQALSGALDAAGLGTASVSPPALPPFCDARTVHVQPVFVSTAAEVVLGSGSSLTWVSAAL